MIHRQNVEHAIRLLHIHHAAEAVGDRHQPVMVDVGGLRQPGRAAGIDEKRPILDREHGLFRRAERCRRKRLDRLVDPEIIQGRLAVRPYFRRALQKLPRGFEVRGEIGADNDMLRLDDVHAMREALSVEIGVEQRDDAASPRHAEPERHVVRPVEHEERDDIAFSDIVRLRPARIAVGALVEAAIAERLPVGDQGRAVPVFGCERRNHVGEGPAFVLHDGLHLAQGAQGAREQRPVFPQAIEQVGPALSFPGVQ